MNKRMMGAAVLMAASAAVGGWPLAASAQPAEMAAGRFVAQGAEVTDTLTGLIWRRCSEGQSWTGSTCEGSTATFTWQGALDQARSAAAGEGVPWRLPNAKELSSLVDDSRIDPAIDTAVFQGTLVHFWTSTHVAGMYLIWVVDFYDGLLYQGYRNGYPRAVRLVRAGQ